MKNNTLRLLTIHLKEIFSLKKMKANKETNKLILFGLLYGVVGLVLIFYVAIISVLIISINLADYLMPAITTVASLIILFTSIFKSSSFLFNSKDTEMLMAMPIKKESIAYSKILTLYIFELPFAAGIILPAFITHCILVASPPAFYIYSVLMIPFIPVIPIIIATFIGALLTFITSRFKFAGIMNTIITIVFLVGFIVLIYNPNNFTFLNNIETFDDTTITKMGTDLLSSVLAFYPVAILIKIALSGSFLALIGFIAGSLILAYLFTKILSAVYIKILTMLKSRKTGGNYKIRELKTSTPLKALYSKELKRYFSSSIYVVNTAIGSILLIVAAAAICFMPKDSLNSFLSDFDAGIGTSFIGKILPLLSCMLVGMSATTPPSLSLEGKNMWILQSLPVKSASVFHSKVLVNLTISVPAIIISGILFIASGFLDLTGALLVFILPTAFSIFMAYIGLLLNYYNLKLEWKNEVTVVKQSMPTMITVFVSMFGGMLLMPFVITTPDNIAKIFMSVFSVIILLAAFIINKSMSKMPVAKIKE